MPDMSYRPMGPRDTDALSHDSGDISRNPRRGGCLVLRKVILMSE